MAEHGIPIEVKELYKIFGTNPGAYIDAVKQGMTKAELNEKHGHVLGCPVHSLGAEISTLDEGLRKKLQEILAQYVCYYESAIRDANTQGLIDTPDAAATARVVFAYTEGVLGHARIWNDLRRLDELEAGLFAILGFAPKS